VRPLIWLLALLVAGPCRAWDTPPHQQITQAALDALPGSMVQRLGEEAGLLVEIYCIYPDRYEEMERFGFVRKSPGPRTAAEIRRYCVRPDGQAVHGASGERETDLGSLVFLLERMAANLSQHQPGEAARYAGVLSHFVADSLSPPHAIAAEQLADMLPPAQAGLNIHKILEQSAPGFNLAGRAPRKLDRHVAAVAKAVLERCYAQAAQNRRDLPAMVRAACARDEQTLNVYRLRAAKRAAEILADALYSILGMAGGAR
jgi:hypothetical protein